MKNKLSILVNKFYTTLNVENYVESLISFIFDVMQNPKFKMCLNLQEIIKASKFILYPDRI